MREIVGFIAGIAAGATATAMATSQTGRRVRERLLTEADPEVRSALEEWDPLLREFARAVRLGAREIEETLGRAARFMSESSTTELEPASDVPPSDTEIAGAVDAGPAGPVARSTVDTVDAPGVEPG